MRKSYGFFPQMKAEGIAFKEEKSGAIVIGTNPGFHNGVLDIETNSNGTQTVPALTQNDADVGQRNKRSFNCTIGEAEVKATVRRLTPLECERLQGFPDNYTNIGEWTDTKGKVHKESSDSARYKALGNSIALPFWFYLLRRISAQYERPATLGSLFDGIGGFPLCWARCNGVNSVRWASEIEEFPIAVTKKHFGDEDLGIEGDIRKYL